MTQDPVVQSSVAGWLCKYPHCKERRLHHIELLHHIESDHASVEELEGRIISDNKGRIIALAPILLSRNFPEVGLPQEELTSLLQRRAGVPRPTVPIPQVLQLQDGYQPTQAAIYPNSTQQVPPETFHSNAGSLPAAADCRPHGQAQVLHPLLHDLLNACNATTSSPPNSAQYDMPPALPIAHLPSVTSLKTPVRRGLKASVGNVPPVYSPDSGRGSESSLDGSSFVKQTSLVSKAPLAPQQTTEEGASVEEDDDDNSENSEDSDDGFTPINAQFSAKKILNLSQASAVEKPCGLTEFTCSVPTCGRKLTSLNGMKYHARSGMHQNKKPFPCAKCGKKHYFTAEKLAEHSVLCAGAKQGTAESTVTTRKTSKRTRNDSLKEDEGLVADLPPSLPEPNSAGLYSPSSKLHILLTNSANTKAVKSRKQSKKNTKI
ncbi:hypothetical protein RvY_18817 [Ramazzottius varieornatus]|uniref:C2H2-type domain-containing protein n=1 Tax=Ramazzottius varieornatus TaxID=947166 RepID=A0A1D1W799_RAMVA|nr:hypothetical protein RvY_18817 [Ramazzottius varieornatus]